MSLLTYFKRVPRPSDVSSHNSTETSNAPPPLCTAAITTACESRDVTISCDSISNSASVVSSSALMDSLTPTISSSKNNMPSTESACDLGVDVPSTRRGPFPVTMFGLKQRCFSNKWYNGRPWLEYSSEMDAAFCFCCRKFAISSSTGEHAFRRNGFRNWKSALEKGRGFALHETSADHKSSMCAWKELQTREHLHQEVSTLVNDTQLTNNRYYVCSLLDIFKFLVTNELPLRGDKEGAADDSSDSAGLFRKLFNYTLMKDSKLAAILSTIPKNATYRSVEMQNEIISIMAELVQEEIVSKIKAADIPYYSIKVDGTKDATGTENVSIVCRSVGQGKPFEHLLSIDTTVELNAEALCTTILNTLKSVGLDPKHIVTQCFDGAAVMAGVNGGVQNLLQRTLEKEIPYVHCFSHRLHLVIVDTISSDSNIECYFDTCSALYKFTKKHSVAKLYEGDSLKRLLPQRWTGHLFTIRAILQNYQELLSLLHRCASSMNTAEISIKACGLLAHVDSLLFAFLTCLLNDLLSRIEPANNALQSTNMDLLSASEIVSSVRDQLRQHRGAQYFDKLYNSATRMTTSAAAEKPEDVSNASIPKRRRMLPPHLSDFVLTNIVGGHYQEMEQDGGLPNRDQLLSIYHNAMDGTIAELESRFSAQNIHLLESMAALMSITSDSFNMHHMTEVAKLCEVDIHGATAEIDTARAFIRKKVSEGAVAANLHDMTSFMYNYRDAFPSVYRLFATAVSVGASTATCESSFSTLSRILSPYRRSMLHTRKVNLILLAFERQFTQAIQEEPFLQRFNKGHNRRLQLY